MSHQGINIIRYYIPIIGVVLLFPSVYATFSIKPMGYVNPAVICEATIIVSCIANIILSKSRRVANLVWSLSICFISIYLFYILNDVVGGAAM